MSIAEIIYAHSRRFPEQAAREALSYIEFLRTALWRTNAD
jgi:hypothetical protein